MTHRLLVTIAALVSALSLSASVALAAAPTRTSVSSAATTPPGHSCGHAYGSVASRPQAQRPTKPAINEGDGNSDIETDEDGGGSSTDNARPHNHGWYVSQVAKDHSVTGRAHGQAVSAVAKSDQGK